MSFAERWTDDADLDDSSIVIQGLLELSRSTAFIGDGTTKFIGDETTKFIVGNTTEFIIDGTTATIGNSSTAVINDNTTEFIVDGTTESIVDGTTEFIVDGTTKFIIDGTTAANSDGPTAAIGDSSTAAIGDGCTAVSVDGITEFIVDGTNESIVTSDDFTANTSDDSTAVTSDDFTEVTGNDLISDDSTEANCGVYAFSAPWSPGADDESTMSIGEIGVDDYFEVKRDHVDFKVSTAAAAAGTSTDNNGKNDGNTDGNSDGNDEGNNDGNQDGNNSDFLPYDFRDKMKDSHTCILNKSLAADTKKVVYSTPKPRAAAIKATEAITKCCSKRKRRQTAKNDETAKKTKECFVENPTLEVFGINVTTGLYRNYCFDRQIMSRPHNYLITSVPAKPTVHEILTDFAKKNIVNADILEFIQTLFDEHLGGWCLYQIEKLQFDNMLEKFPDSPRSQVYGVIHFYRFLHLLPTKLRLTTEDAPVFVKYVTPLLNKLLTYMESEKIEINFDINYQHVMPDYYRMTFCPIRPYAKLNRP